MHCILTYTICFWFLRSYTCLNNADLPTKKLKSFTTFLWVTQIYFLSNVRHTLKCGFSGVFFSYARIKPLINSIDSNMSYRSKKRQCMVWVTLPYLKHDIEGTLIHGKNIRKNKHKFPVYIPLLFFK